jgi:hypothetical protein
MTVLIRIICGACGGNAGMGLDFEHACFSVEANGGRIFNGQTSVCSGCAKVTR